MDQTIRFVTTERRGSSSRTRCRARVRRCSKRPTGSITWSSTGRARYGTTGSGSSPRITRCIATTSAAAVCPTGGDNKLSFDDQVADLECIAEHRAGEVRAARHLAGRVEWRSNTPCAIRSGSTHLVIYGGFVRGWAKRSPDSERAGRALGGDGPGRLGRAQAPVRTAACSRNCSSPGASEEHMGVVR